MGNLADVDDKVSSGLFFVLLVVVGAVSLALGSIAYQNAEPDVVGDLVFRIENDPTVQQAVEASVQRSQAVQRNSAKVTAVQGVRAAAGTNVDLASVPGQVDGVALVAGDRVLLFGQTTAAENGIYLVESASTWTVSAEELNLGLPVYVAEGDTYGGQLRVIQSAASSRVPRNGLAISGGASYASWPAESLPTAQGVLVSDPVAVTGLNFSSCPNVSGTLTVNGALVANTLTINGNAVVSEALTVPAANVASISSTGAITSSGDGFVVQHQVSADTTLPEDWSGSVVAVTPSGANVAVTLPPNPRDGTYFRIEADVSAHFTSLELQAERLVFGTLSNTAGGLSYIPSSPPAANLEAGPGVTTGQTKAFIGLVYVGSIWHIEGIANGWQVRAAKS